MVRVAVSFLTILFIRPYWIHVGDYFRLARYSDTINLVGMTFQVTRSYLTYQTCHRRFQQRQRSGMLEQLQQKLAEDLRDRRKLDLSESFIDASYSSAKKGALRSSACRATGVAFATFVAGCSVSYLID